MATSTKNLPIRNIDVGEVSIRSTEELGRAVVAWRKAQGLTQLDMAGLANTGNRFIVDLEGGKKTIQMQKALEVIALLGLEVVLRPKSTGGRP